VGKGTQFEVIFPLVQTKTTPAAGDGPEREAVEGEGKTVLVIDDEPYVLELVRDIFTELKFTVLGSLNPVEGVELFRKDRDRINAVILDYSMPGMDGRMAFEELRKIDPNVKVLLCSGYTEEETASAFGPNKPKAFIQKPYKPRDVVDAVVKMMGKGEAGAGGEAPIH
jgi:CheY-like chemotaxis protein